MTHRVLSRAGLALIREHEGFHAAPAPLPCGKWVVGYGHVRAAGEGGRVTEEEAADLLGADVIGVERMVNAMLTSEVTQSQFDALVSFAFSVGAEAFAKSDVLRRTNAGDAAAAACALDAWRVGAAGEEVEILETLLRRRAAEKAHYLRDIAKAGAPSALVRARVDHAAAILGAPSRRKAAAKSQLERTAPEPMQQKPSPAARLTEILLSEPATKALLLTQVVNEEEEVLELTTAHAKPVARAVNENEAPAASYRLDFGGPREAVGLAALSLFGVGLVAMGGLGLLGGAKDIVDFLSALALILPGVAAIAFAGFGLLQAPASERKRQ